jgi:preprotein translocase subunit YajC
LNLNSPVVTIIWFVVLIAIFWFLLLRPQRQEQKRREDMIKSLQRGARVVTMGGLHGTIVDLNEDTALVRIAEKVEVTVSRSSVAQVLVGKDKKATEPRAKTPKATRVEDVTNDDTPAD